MRSPQVGCGILNNRVVEVLDISDQLIDRAAIQERQEWERRERAYRGDRPKLEVYGRTVILVDDGLATGASMRAAIAALRGRGPARIIVAVPTAAAETCAQFEDEVDDIICATTPEPFWGVGAWYGRVYPKSPMPKYVPF